jgi:hypothetical protein
MAKASSASEETEEVVAEEPRSNGAKKAKKLKVKRTKHPFMSEQAYDEAQRVWEEEFEPTLTEEQEKLLGELKLFFRDTIGWKHAGMLILTGNPRKE